MKKEKYLKYSISDLIAIAQKHFNAYIRKRDIDKGCISCGAKITEAGHYYSAGSCSLLRFNEKNVHGQCYACNEILDANLIEYRKGLISRFDEKTVLELDYIADIYKKIQFKWDKIELIEIIDKYKHAVKHID